MNVLEKCPNCGYDNSLATPFCPECATPLRSLGQDPQPNPRSTLVAGGNIKAPSSPAVAPQRQKNINVAGGDIDQSVHVSVVQTRLDHDEYVSAYREAYLQILNAVDTSGREWLTRRERTALDQLAVQLRIQPHEKVALENSLQEQFSIVISNSPPDLWYLALPGKESMGPKREKQLIESLVEHLDIHAAQEILVWKQGGERKWIPCSELTALYSRVVEGRRHRLAAILEHAHLDRQFSFDDQLWPSIRGLEGTDISKIFKQAAQQTGTTFKFRAGLVPRVLQGNFRGSRDTSLVLRISPKEITLQTDYPYEMSGGYPLESVTFVAKFFSVALGPGAGDLTGINRIDGQIEERGIAVTCLGGEISEGTKAFRTSYLRR